ncbi:penicillin-binding protein activator [Devosia sp.]|uniref:penicillin-binding protein activator n=1 Tax=Devosia sp. TaxID=1871048 RepID=UPI003264EE95
MSHQQWAVRHRLRVVLAALCLGALVACAPGDYSIGSRSFSFGAPQTPPPQAIPNMQAQAGPIPNTIAPGAIAVGQSFGQGPVRVALLLPLSGDPALSGVGSSLANASRLAVSYIESNSNIADNITVILKDTGTSPGGAAQAASEAVAEGASIILGPLKADQVTAAGGVARSAGIPLIGFSNNASAAGPGVYLLSVLPENEVRRSLTLVQAQGRTKFAAVFPNTDYGRVQERAFGEIAAALGISPAAIYHFGNETEARGIVTQLGPQISAGQVDALFLPDRGTAPSFATMLEQTGVARPALTIIGSADWEGDPAILATPFLGGAVYPAVDPAGYNAIVADYQRQFGGNPHPLATIAYTATILANVSALSMSNPKYDRETLTAPSGFNGRDGVFRFNPNGRADYALVVKQVAPGGAQLVDGPRM